MKYFRPNKKKFKKLFTIATRRCCCFAAVPVQRRSRSFPRGFLPVRHARKVHVHLAGTSLQYRVRHAHVHHSAGRHGYRRHGYRVLPHPVRGHQKVTHARSEFTFVDQISYPDPNLKAGLGRGVGRALFGC